MTQLWLHVAECFLKVAYGFRDFGYLANEGRSTAVGWWHEDETPVCQPYKLGTIHLSFLARLS